MLKYSVLAVYLTCFRAIVISNTLADSSAHGRALRTLGPLGLLIVILKTIFLQNFSQIHRKTFFHIFCAGSFKYLTTFLRQNCITNNRDAANSLHKIYDKNSIVDCELLAYALDNIVHNALYDKINVY